MINAPQAQRRGSVIIIVLWAIGIAAIVTGSVQLFAYRQATLGREALHRIQARWAARSGLESTIASMALHTERPIRDDSFALPLDMEYYSTSKWAELTDAIYDIRHHAEGRDWAGPQDEHSKININGASPTSYELLEDITPDVVAAIVDWLDEDDEPSLLGAEQDWYMSMSSPYKPRNGPFRSIAELELVAGIWPDTLRGEDWNLNSKMDANEDDGQRTLPDDEPDRYLETGWAGRLTAYSVDGGATTSGGPRIYLRRADVQELMERCDLEQLQAETLMAFGKNEENTLLQLLSVELSQIDDRGQVGSAEVNPSVEPLSDEQLISVLAETTMLPLYERVPGKLNINTVSVELIQDLLELEGFEEAVADEIIYMRNSRVQGITNILDLYDIPDMTPEMVQQLAETFTTSSNVYTVAVKGRSISSDMEVEIIAVVDRSTIPIRILEYREQ